MFVISYVSLLSSNVSVFVIYYVSLLSSNEPVFVIFLRVSDIVKLRLCLCYPQHEAVSITFYVSLLAPITRLFFECPCVLLSLIRQCAEASIHHVCCDCDDTSFFFRPAQSRRGCHVAVTLLARLVVGTSLPSLTFPSPALLSH